MACVTAVIDTTQKLQALRCPACYPGAASSVEVIETHFAWIFMVGPHAYKMKKPVHYIDLDLRTLAARKRNCDEEVRLNRRLAPDVYYGVVPLARTGDGTLRVDGEGEPVDWLIWMRRLPSHLMLDRAISAGRVPAGSLRQVGIRLARFYRQQNRYSYRPPEYLARLDQQIREDQRALLAPELQLDAAGVHAMIDMTRRAMDARSDELGQRALQERIVDAHGDLRPEHICLSDPPCIIDALEFSADLRTLDALEELAFLMVECEVAGAADVGVQILDAYGDESFDRFSPGLLDFYRARRTTVRAKIIAWHLCDPSVMHLAPWASRAGAYIEMADRYARRSMETSGS